MIAYLTHVSAKHFQLFSMVRSTVYTVYAPDLAKSKNSKTTLFGPIPIV